MKRTLLLIGIFTVVLEACTLSATAAPTAALMPTGTSSLTDTVTPLVLPTEASTPTLIPTTALPPSATDTAIPSLTPTLACETDTASVVLSASSENLKVGDTVKIIVTINNEGCVALGLPQYSLSIQSDEAVFSPVHPEPVVHNLGVGLEESDSAEFDLQAVASGQVKLTASVSYEVHLGYPGPAYWGQSASEPLIITVAP